MMLLIPLVWLLPQADPADDPFAPPPSGTIEAALARGVDHLLATQNKDGSWGSPRWTGGVDSDPWPGAFHSFGVATTAMVMEALLEAPATEATTKAIERAEAYLMAEFPRLRRADLENVPNIWGYCYGIQALAEVARPLPADSPRRARCLAMIRDELIPGLKRFETVHGGWFYYADGATQRPLAPAASFVNAAVLSALHRARSVGVEPDPKLIERGLASIRMMRKPDSSYLYSGSTPLDRGDAASLINRPAGSLGRSQACNHALRLYGDSEITDEVLQTWLDRLVLRQGWLDMGRKKPIPHESFAQVAGYFYYFGHYYAAMAIGHLPPEKRPRYRAALARILVERQEEDGSWWDYPLFSYHKPYGTAFALLALRRGQIEAENPPPR